MSEALVRQTRRPFFERWDLARFTKRRIVHLEMAILFLIFSAMFLVREVEAAENGEPNWAKLVALGISNSAGVAAVIATFGAILRDAAKRKERNAGQVAPHTHPELAALRSEFNALSQRQDQKDALYWSALDVMRGEMRQIRTDQSEHQTRMFARLDAVFIRMDNVATDMAARQAAQTDLIVKALAVAKKAVEEEQSRAQEKA